MSANRRRTWCLLALLLSSVGCVVPGRMYLHPPGYSSTFERIQLEQATRMQARGQEVSAAPATVPHGAW